MSSNNLRIIYNNIADNTTTLVAINSDTGYSISNTKKDTKGLVWRSTSGNTSSTIDLSWNTSQSISSVVLPYTNLSSTATIRIRIYSDSLFANVIYDSGTSLAVLAVLPNYNAGITGVNYRYSFGGGSYVRKYIPQIDNCKALKIDIVDTNNTDGFLEISRIIAGTYWSPKYNTEYGLSVGISDSSNKYRTQTGNLITDIGTSSKTLSFNLSYMDNNDRDVLFSIIKSIGTKKSIHISLFPEDSDTTKELIYQVYGRFSDLATISNPMYSMYASTVNVEEV